MFAGDKNILQKRESEGARKRERGTEETDKRDFVLLGQRKEKDKNYVHSLLPFTILKVY